MSLELAGCGLVHGDDGLTVTTAVLIDMCQCLFERTHRLDGQLIVHKLRTEAVGCGRLQIGVFAIKGSISLLISVDDHVFLGEGGY